MRGRNGLRIVCCGRKYMHASICVFVPQLCLCIVIVIVASVSELRKIVFVDIDLSRYFRALTMACCMNNNTIASILHRFKRRPWLLKGFIHTAKLNLMPRPRWMSSCGAVPLPRVEVAAPIRGAIGWKIESPLRKTAENFSVITTPTKWKLQRPI